MFSGWATGSPLNLSFFGDTISFGDCDGKGLEDTLQPFGFITLEGKRFFVVDGAPYEGERATILELRGDRLVDILPSGDD